METGKAVLVVDDEFLVRLAVCDYLHDCGFTTYAAADAAEAMAILGDGRRIDVVFTDIEMPGPMDGVDLAQWVGQHRPGVLVILTSGHEKKAKEAQALCEGARLLPKPVTLQELERLLSEAPPAL